MMKSTLAAALALVLVLCAATAVHGGTVAECTDAQAAGLAASAQCIADKTAAAGTDACNIAKETYKCMDSSMSSCCSGEALTARKAAINGLAGCTLTDAEMCPNSAAGLRASVFMALVAAAASLFASRI
jgi:hypothetical protein